MTRAITIHHTDDTNKRIIVEGWDDPGQGGANCVYRLSVNRADHNQEIAKIRFLSNAISGDGITNESLIAVLIDRLRGFQNGPYSCRENSIALTKLEEALFWLQARTKDREVRGVTGKNVK